MMEQVKHFRKLKKVTQAQMAKKMGLSRGGYIRLEHMVSKTISFDQIQAICSELGLRVVFVEDAEFEARNAIKPDAQFWEGLRQDLKDFYSRNYEQANIPGLLIKKKNPRKRQNKAHGDAENNI